MFTSLGLEVKEMEALLVQCQAATADQFARAELKLETRMGHAYLPPVPVEITAGLGGRWHRDSSGRHHITRQITAGLGDRWHHNSSGRHHMTQRITAVWEVGGTM